MSDKCCGSCAENFDPYGVIKRNVKVLEGLRDSAADDEKRVMYCREIANQVHLLFQMEYARVEAYDELVNGVKEK